jgi:Mrp family chromosome partitioning ATPase
MLQALKNLEAKEARPQTTRTSAVPGAAAVVVARPAAVASPSAEAPSSAPIAPRIIEVVDKLDAVVGHELSGISSPISSSAFGSTANYAFADSVISNLSNADALSVPTLVTGPQNQPETRATSAVPVTKSASELERQVKRVLNDRVRSQPLLDLADRLVRDMEQSESKILAFGSLGVSNELHLPILQAAMALAETRSKRVLLIDGDLRRRGLSDGLEYGRCAGLSELIAGKAEITSVCQATATKQLSFVPAGKAEPGNESAIGDVLEKALAQLKADFDCLLIDAGNAGSDSASALAQASDAAYLVVELGAVETNTAQAALAGLRAAGARVLGCIAT